MRGKLIFIFWTIGILGGYSVSAQTEIDTVRIRLIEKDTTFYGPIARLSGSLYQFVNPTDSNYLSLYYLTGAYDMGTAGCYPRYDIKKTAEEGIYIIFVNDRWKETFLWTEGEKKIF